MPETHITNGNLELKFLDCFRSAQRLRSTMAGRPALRGHSDPVDNLGISRGHITFTPTYMCICSSHYFCSILTASSLRYTSLIPEKMKHLHSISFVQVAPFLQELSGAQSSTNVSIAQHKNGCSITLTTSCHLTR